MAKHRLPIIQRTTKAEDRANAKSFIRAAHEVPGRRQDYLRCAEGIIGREGVLQILREDYGYED